MDGDIVADDSYFPYDPYPAGWTEGDLVFRFGAPVSAIAFNDNSFHRAHASRRSPLALRRSCTVEPEAAASTFGHELAHRFRGREIRISPSFASRDRIFFCFAAPSRSVTRR